MKRRIWIVLFVVVALSGCATIQHAREPLPNGEKPTAWQWWAEAER